MDLATAVGLAVVVGVIGGFELVDRTSFALIALASRHPPRPVWLGGALAFLTTSLLAVTVGAALVAALGPSRIDLVRIGGGAFLLGYAAWVARQPELLPAERPGVARSVIATAFLTVLLLELGDTTMIFEIVFVPTFGIWIVLVGGFGALALVAAWDVVLGRYLGARLRPSTLKWLVVGALAAVGVGTLAYGLVALLG